VRAAALAAVVRAAGVDTEALATAAADPHPAVRRRACVLVGRALSAGGAPAAGAGNGNVASLVDVLVAELADDDASVVETASWALGEAGDRCSPMAVDALAAVARTHLDPLCREAAVAALGAVGDARGLPAVFAALSDKAPVRRRAVIALSAFDDPGVEDAWRRHLDDRDWQVRQAAEDLLGRS
jgi:HEAT repeat protein